MIEPCSNSMKGQPAPSQALPEDAQALLADKFPPDAQALYLLAAVALALAYGSTFLLADALHEAGLAAAGAGSVVGTATLATLTGAVFAGRWAERLGLLNLICCAAIVMASALACFAMIGPVGTPAAYVGGLLLGLGWSVFYMLAPIQIIQCLKPTARLQAFTLLSGAQMLGMGLAAPLGHFLERRYGGISAAFAVYSVFCVIAALFVLLVRRRLALQPQLTLQKISLSLSSIARVLKSKTLLPILLITVSASIFAALSTFQSLYSQSRALSPDIFFITFTVTTVVLRFTLAASIAKLPLDRLALSLFVLTLCGIALLTLNKASVLLYIIATLLFAIGYGLTYATLNAAAVNLAESLNIPASIASQVFTLGYFTGTFGFPSIAGALIAASNVDVALAVLMGLAGLNLLIAGLFPALSIASNHFSHREHNSVKN